jgi:hypothetical protein
MQFNPETNALYTDAGELVKVLHCPLRKQWNQLVLHPSSAHRTCAECERSVLDTSGMTDAEVLKTVRANPMTCLAVGTRQANVTLLYDAPLVPALKRTGASGSDSH